jgi:pilus assembly protein Flp/PilA
LGDAVEIMLKALVARRSHRGASAVEYGLLVAAIAAVVAVVVFALGNVVKTTLFENTCQKVVDESPSLTDNCG